MIRRVSHSDYGPGDIVRINRTNEEWIVEIREKQDDVKKGRPGWTGEIVEVVQSPDSYVAEPGDNRWGYTKQVVEVIEKDE